VPAESTNHIDSLPDCIANMTELEELSVSAVGLQQLTPALFQIKTLRKLDISFNPDLNLSPYWNEFIELPALSFLAVSGCEFDPKDLRKFQSERPEVEVINLGKWNTPR
jgi:Leucine-rich repeat (LRR) protein